MNVVFSSLGENHFSVVKAAINAKLIESYHRSYDIFFELLSSVWLSPTELGEKWISKICPNEWKLLQDDPREPINIRKEKEEVRKSLAIETALAISIFADNPRAIQMATTRLLVKETLTQNLGLPDQDRIIAKTLLAKFHVWKAFFSTLSVHDVLTDTRRMVGDPHFHIDSNGEDAVILTVDGHIDPIEGLEDAPIQHGIDSLRIDTNGVKQDTKRATTQILFSPSILRHHQGMIITGEREKKTRKALFASRSPIPAFKRRAFGDATSGPEPDVKLSNNPA